MGVGKSMFLAKVRLFAATLSSCMLFREYSTQEIYFIVQHLPENGITNCELTNRKRLDYILAASKSRLGEDPSVLRGQNCLCGLEK